ncbi:hypothetical protein [Ekhidna sp.]
MKKYLLVLMIMSSLSIQAQNGKISTIDFVQILNDNREEAVFYYQNNWLELRKIAVAKSYIDSFEIIEVQSTPEASFHLILKTTYKNQAAYEKSEDRFQKIIEENGPLKLLNDKKPGDFRKVIFYKEKAIHLF